MSRKLAFACVVLGASVTGFVSWYVASGLADPTPAPASMPDHGIVQLQIADAGREVRLRPGQWLAVNLPATSASGYRCWIQDPASRVLSIEQEPARAVLSHAWIFRAASGGLGHLGFDCRHDLSVEPPLRFEYMIRVD
ncbi:hypothetical protein MNR01_11970 [Lysobacter sp. S4-A87]|uniref:hypothetical protein n=1 Tax=Lysobacter sp. S4-A87 TaxID=2925843 RepID=UPI001F538C41|nr:hypothetical protein [Lysobacter sp. S4-A87]UNK48473.1 hypothetical protein MNR01_11970 [Lysobacter sp. S4-A87]